MYALLEFYCNMFGNISLELRTLGCSIRGSEIENRMFQSYCGCCELLIRCFFVKESSPCLIDMGSLNLDLLLLHLGLGGLLNDYYTAVIGTF